MKCEKIIKSEMLTSLPNVSTISRIKNIILTEFLCSDVFLDLNRHSFSQSAFNNHRILLNKSVKYLNIRIIYLGKSKTNKALSIRHQSNKLELFKGQ